MPDLLPLPWLLRWLQPIDFPFKLGFCERLYGNQLAPYGVRWVQTGAGIPWKVDLANRTHRWMVYGKYEGAAFLNWAKAFLPSDGVVVDSGANIGQMVAYLAQDVPKGRVFAFEPGRDAAGWLAECLAVHPGLPVEIVRMGLGASNEPQSLVSYGPEMIHGAWSQITTGGGPRVLMIRLDDFLKQRSIEQVDLWKLDIEGYEPLALEGARSFLERQRIRALSVELLPGKGAVIRETLGRFGYEGFIFRRSGRLAPLPASAESTNALFLPYNTAV